MQQFGRTFFAKQESQAIDVRFRSLFPVDFPVGFPVDFPVDLPINFLVDWDMMACTMKVKGRRLLIRLMRKTGPSLRCKIHR